MPWLVFEMLATLLVELAAQIIMILRGASSSKFSLPRTMLVLHRRTTFQYMPFTLRRSGFCASCSEASPSRSLLW